MDSSHPNQNNHNIDCSPVHNKNKLPVNHRAYEIIPLETRLELIRLSSKQGYSISRASRELGVKLSTGKFIVKRYREYGKIIVKNQEDQIIEGQIPPPDQLPNRFCRASKKQLVDGQKLYKIKKKYEKKQDKIICREEKILNKTQWRNKQNGKYEDDQDQQNEQLSFSIEDLDELDHQVKIQEEESRRECKKSNQMEFQPNSPPQKRFNYEAELKARKKLIASYKKYCQYFGYRTPSFCNDPQYQQYLTHDMSYYPYPIIPPPQCIYQYPSICHGQIDRQPSFPEVFPSQYQQFGAEKRPDNEPMGSEKAEQKVKEETPDRIPQKQGGYFPILKQEQEKYPLAFQYGRYPYHQ